MNHARKWYLQLFDFLLWLSLAIYLLGGFWYHGNLKLTYAADLWTACSIAYVIGRVAFRLRFRETRFGQSFHELLDHLTLSIFERKRPLISGVSAPATILAGAVVYSMALFFYLPLLHYWNGGGRWDIGIVENAVFNASRTGQFTTYLLSDGIRSLHYVPNNHLDLGLGVFALIYRVFPHAEIILFAQSLALISAIFPLYWLGKRILPKELPPWFPVVLFLLWDPVYRMNIWDIHEPPFLIPFTLWGLYFIEARRAGLAYFFMILMAIWREDAWWTFAAMSLYMGIRLRDWKVALPGMFIGGALFPLHVIFLNHVNKINGAYYPFLAPNLVLSVKMIASKPWILVTAVLRNWKFFSGLLLRTGGGLFLLAGVALIPALPALAEVGLSLFMSDWTNYYVGTFSAPLIVATLYGWREAHRYLEKRFPGKGFTELASGISIALCLTQLTFSLPGAVKKEQVRSSDRACLDLVAAQVPPYEPVLAGDDAQTRILTRLSHREWIMVPELGKDQTRAQWLVSMHREDLLSGLSGSIPVKPWQIVWEGCGYFVARRVVN